MFSWKKKKNIPPRLKTVQKTTWLVFFNDHAWPTHGTPVRYIC